MKRLATVTLSLWCAVAAASPCRPGESCPGWRANFDPEDPKRPANYSDVADDGAIVLIGGGARTFLCTFDKLLESFIVPLDEPRGGADVYAYLKATDPGPKGQRGFNYHYKDADAGLLREKLATYPNVVGSTIIPEPACQGQCLIARHVRCRGRFTEFLRDDMHLARYVAFAVGLEYLGTELFALEAVRGRRYAVVAWMRPDILPNAKLPDYALLAKGHPAFRNPKCTGGPRNPPGSGHPDMSRVFPRETADLYLFKPMQILRDCSGKNNGPWKDAESFWAPNLDGCIDTGHCGGCLESYPLRECNALAVYPQEAASTRPAARWGAFRGAQG